MGKKDFLKKPAGHIDIKPFDSTAIIEAVRSMSFTSVDTAGAADIFNMMGKQQRVHCR